MMKKIKERARDFVAFIIGHLLLKYCAGLINWIYDRLPHSVLSYLVHHGFFGKASHTFPWHVTLTNGRRLCFEVNPEDEYSTGYAFLYKVHDVGLRRAQEHWISQLPGRSVYLDIGSNIGVSSINALSCGKECWLFEPNTMLRPFVERLFAKNSYRTAKFHDVALSDQAGEACFYVSKSSYLSSFNVEHASVEGEVTPLQVQMRTLDSYLPELRAVADQVLVKIDVEGHEMAVLRGAVQTLRHYQPAVMIELLHDLTAREAACRFMWDLGYRCHGIVNAPVLTLRELSELSSVQSFDDINFLFLPLQSVNSAS